jgi:Zn-dependent metalloprotease
MRTYIAFLMLVVSYVVWAADQPMAAPRLQRTQDLTVEVDSEALQRQYLALLAIAPKQVEYSARGPVNSIQGATGLTLPTSVRNLTKESEAADTILPLLGDALLARGNESLIVRDNSLIDASTRGLRLSQSIRGIPVIHGVIAIDYDDSSLRVNGLTANFVPDYDLPRSPKLSAQEAEKIVPESLRSVKDLQEVEIEIMEGTYLAYYADPDDPAPPQLVWVVEVALGSMSEQFFVNAISGVVAGRLQLSHSLTRTVYNANEQYLTIPSGITAQYQLSQSQINADQQAKNAYDHIDQANTTLLSRLPYAASKFPSNTKIIVRYVHVNPDPPHTATHKLTGGIDYLTFSGGPFDGYNPWTTPRDIAVHEFGHGIGDRAMGWSGDQVSDNQVGALHEFLGDFMTTVVDVAFLGVNAPESWRIADGLYVVGPQYNMRSFKNPKFDTFTQPLNQDFYPSRVMGSSTAPHRNATILGHAYYLTIFGGQNEDAASPDIPDITVTALDMDATTAESRVREIFMRAFMDNTMASAPNFVKMKTAAMAQAFSFYGSAARTTVKDAFEAVGICGTDTAPPSSVSNFNLEDLMCVGRFNASWTLSPNVSRYYAEVAPAQLGFSFATPVTDVNGSTSHCLFQVTGPMVYRIRACNSCGCGAWSQTYSLPY